jgi:P-type conjugative transfer protein TrbG
MNRLSLMYGLCLSALLVSAAAPPPVPVPKSATAVPVRSAGQGATVQVAPGIKLQAHQRIAHARRRSRFPSPVLRAVALANAAATLEPAAQSFINAVQIYPFVEGSVYRVYTAPGEVTDIALQPGEALGAVASGDTVRWVIGDTSSGSGDSKRTHVLVKPFTAGLSTNLVITTDRRSYHVALASTPRTAMSALSWTYPQDALIALRKTAAQEVANTPVASGLAVESLHFDYQVTGDQPTWRPLRAFDDGRQTFIQFPADLAVGEAPPLFILNGKDAQLVNYRVQGRFYVVDRLFDAAELRLGTKHQDVVRISHTTDGSAQRRRAS